VTFMRRVVIGVLALSGLLVNLGAADKAWVGALSSDWFEPANWDPVGVPAPTDSIAITNPTSIVITDNVLAASLELRRATLVVSNQLTVTNLSLTDGARLTAWVTRPNPVTNPPAGFGVIEIPSGGRLDVLPASTVGSPAGFTLEGARLNLRGAGVCTNRATILLFFRSELNVFGTLTLSDEVTFDGANGPPSGSLNNYGLLSRSSGTNLSLLSVNLTNRGSVVLQSGTMNIGNGLNSGLMSISSGATQSFIGAPFQ